MRIAIFSDSHDHEPNLTKALSIVNKMDITHGIHLGDYCSQKSIDLLLRTSLHWILVKGNNDVSASLPPEDFQEHTIDGRQLFLTHYPQIARVAALSGTYDACFYGHTHLFHQEYLQNTLLANPGELCGTRFNTASFAIYTTETNTFEDILL